MDNASNEHSSNNRLAGRNLYLVGMMGCGKSLTGPVLAKELSYGFVDSDSVIEELTKSSISEIFDQEGEFKFRQLENKVLNEIGQRHSLVVATGGGVVTKPNNWGVMHQGVVVWLDLKVDKLWGRLKNELDSRPLIKGIKDEKDLNKIFKDREKFYMEADLRINIQDETPHQISNIIIRELPSILSNPLDQVL